ncbi:sulfotransferase domain-containing protein [Sphingomonas sp.]|uniref:sulfotransferase domain-containing protein n=1 Tax=Sphingomonas sp. TaxID=28214 RepID=UPI003B3A8538
MTARFFWIASYPKSGNTWIRLMLRSLSQGGAPVDLASRASFCPMASRRDALDYWCDIQSSDLTDDEAMALRPLQYAAEAAAADGLLLRKTHDAWTSTPRRSPLFPPALTQGALYIVRDPRDIALSFAAHRGCSVDDTIEMMGRRDATLSRSASAGSAQLRQRLLSWSLHVASWLDATPAPLLLRYEDVVRDPVAALRRVVERLGWDSSPETVEASVAATKLDVLKAAEARQGFVERPLGSATFFRKGQIGEWQQHLSAAQASRIETDHGAMMTRLGYLASS